MSKAGDIEANEALMHHVVEKLDPHVSALVGFEALTELAHTMTPQKFQEFIQSAIMRAQETHYDFTQAQAQNSVANPSTQE
jgi:hypothetical protein